MTGSEIKDRIRQLLKSGIQITQGLPTAPGEAKTNATFGMCSIPSHRCAACDEDKPEIEFYANKTTICLHQKCLQLWNEVRHDLR